MSELPSRRFHQARRAVLWLCCSLAVADVRAETLPAQIETCITCHGAHGKSVSGDVPRLAGQQRTYLANQLNAFRSGERKNPLMQAIASQLNAEEIDMLARYWSRQPVAGAVNEAAPQGLPSAMQRPTGFPNGFSAYDQELDTASRVLTVRYANAAAIQAARAGQPLPSGAVVMSAEYAVAVGADGQPARDAQGRWQAAAIRSLAGMELRQGWGEQVPALLRNGDWQYGLWAASGESRLRGTHAQCLACHKPLAHRQHIFTFETLARPATVPR